MLGFMVPAILSLAAITKAYQSNFPESAASAAQIRFALENRYDDTGPGAKEPQFAYNTYKTLDDALIAYLDDPDTKLPQLERERVIQKFIQPTPNYAPKPGQTGLPVQRYYPKTVEEYTGYNQPKPTPALILTKLKSKKHNSPYSFHQGSIFGDLQSKYSEPYKVQRVQSVRVKPISVAHYSRDPDFKDSRDQFNPHPKYSFTYGVNGPDTGDHKSAHEEREGGAVRGYYSFLDADGSQRTVHYTADDKRGFQATVQRTDHK